MCAAQPNDSKENLKECSNENPKEVLKEIFREISDENTTKKSSNNAQSEHESGEVQQEHRKEQRNKSPKDFSKESPIEQSLGPKNSDSYNEVKSLGNYTGLEGLNLREADTRLEGQQDSRQKCTCDCECDLCINVRAYHEVKCLGIDFDLNTSYLNYLNHLSNLNHFHDLKEHCFEHNLELDNLEELVRLLPDSRLIIAIITFNMNSKHCNDLHELLLPDSLEFFPDIYVVGVQEFMRDSEEVKEWTIELQSTIGSSHVLLHDVSLGVLHLSLFIRRDLIWFVSIPEDDSLLCKLNPPTNFIRTKGAVAISLKIFGTSFLFVNNHLPAHQSRIQERVDEYNRMSTGLDLPRNLKSTLKRSYQSHDITNRFDCAFWFGDLKVNQDQDTALKLIAIAQCEKDKNNKHCFDSIFLHDQLSLSMKKGELLTGFEEASVNFQPTYKYLINTNEYDEESTRIPSYTDRILFKNKRSGHITCKLYSAIQSIKCSDHKPVFGLYQCLIRPCVDDCLSNAGLFNHEVYAEGMKRLNVQKQKMKNDHPERPRGLIANLRARKWFHSSIN